MAHTVDALAPNGQVGELRGGSVSRLGLEVVESGGRPCWKREATAEPPEVFRMSAAGAW